LPIQPTYTFLEKKVPHIPATFCDFDFPRDESLDSSAPHQFFLRHQFSLFSIHPPDPLLRLSSILTDSSTDIMSEEETKPVPTEAAAPVAATADSETTAKPETSQEVAPAAAADAQKDKDAADENAAANAEKEAPPKPANILKTTAQINREDHTKNVKSDPKLLPVTDDPVAIRSQVSHIHSAMELSCISTP